MSDETQSECQHGLQRSSQQKTSIRLQKTSDLSEFMFLKYCLIVCNTMSSVFSPNWFFSNISSKVCQKPEPRCNQPAVLLQLHLEHSLHWSLLLLLAKEHTHDLVYNLKNNKLHIHLCRFNFACCINSSYCKTLIINWWCEQTRGRGLKSPTPHTFFLQGLWIGFHSMLLMGLGLWGP